MTVQQVGPLTKLLGPYLLTAIAWDNFNRANVNPLDFSWSVVAGKAALQIVNNICEATTTSSLCAETYGYSNMPNDQYASFTYAAVPAVTGEAIIGVRSQASNYTNAYRLAAFTGPGPNWDLANGVGPQIQGNTTINAGDSFTITAVGTTITAFQNGTRLGAITDSTFSSGSISLASSSPFGAITDTLISNFEMGSAAPLPFIGSIRIVASPPASPPGPPNPFLWTVVAVPSAPPGYSNPYLGHVVVGADPSPSIPNPIYGQVVVVGSAPAGEPDPFLGTVQENT
jgi:hypothetical protein